MDTGLKGKVAVVTGTGRKGAMGDAIAHELAKEGANIACVDVNIEGAEAIAADVAKLGVKAKAYKVDQSDLSQVEAAVEQINADLGPIGIIVNNAALLGPPGRIESMKLEFWTNMQRVNMDGPYYWTRAAWNTMAENNYGRIIMISSIAGVMGGFGQANYATTKAGVIALAKTAALEGARKGITANAVTLGVINSGQPLEGTDMGQRIQARIAMRKFGTPTDVANLCVFLASDKSGYITGQDLHVMGGLDLFTY